MAVSRKVALKRLANLAPQVERHIEKIASNPDSPSITHWIHEANNWLKAMEELVPHVGRKTGADWTKRIEIWRSRIGG